MREHRHNQRSEIGAPINAPSCHRPHGSPLEHRDTVVRAAAAHDGSADRTYQRDLDMSWARRITRAGNPRLRDVIDLPGHVPDYAGAALTIVTDTNGPKLPDPRGL